MSNRDLEIMADERLQAEVVALQRQRDELAAALRSIEWIEPPWPAIDHEPFCPWCGNYESNDHRFDCGRQTALARLEAGK